MIPLPRHLASLALATLLALSLAPGFAMAQERSHIRITGRVVDKRGVPLRETWVVTQGSRRTGTLTNANGRYTLDVVGGTSEELARDPLLLRIQARRKGWSLGVPGGAPELAIELRIVNDSLGGSRFQVRSSDPRVASMLANDAVLQSGTRIALQLDFVGVRGPQVENEAVAMPALQEVVLVAPRRAPDPEPLAAAPPADDASAIAPREDTEKSPSAPGAAEAPRRPALDPVSELLASARSEREAAAAVRAPDVETSIPPPSAKASGIEAKPPVPAKTEAPKRDAVPRRPANLPPDSELEPPVRRVEETSSLVLDDEPLAVREERSSAAPRRDAGASVASGAEDRNEAIDETPRSSKKKPKRSRVVRPAEPEAMPAGEELPRHQEMPRVIRPGDPEKQAAEVEKRLKRRPRARTATPEEIRRALEILGEPLTPTVNRTTAANPAAEDAAPPPPAAEPPAPVSALEPDRSAAPTETPKPRQAESPPPPSNLLASLEKTTVAAPPTPSAATPGSTVVQSGARAASAQRSDPDCLCRIEGTVEVVSNHPLPERVQVDVTLADDPRAIDTVELFMGSPRQFELTGISCGSHALRVKVRSKLKFMLSSPLPALDCTGGGYRQVRIVLEPLQKKRAR